MVFGQKYIELWKEIDPSQNEHAKIFLNELISNRKDATQRWVKGIYLFILLSAVFVLLSIGNSQEISFLSIKLKDVQVIQLTLPSILAFIYYQSICALFFAENLRELLDTYLKQHLKPVWDANLELSIDMPIFFNIERFFSRHKKHGAKIAASFGIFTSLIILFIPFILCIVFIYTNFQVTSHIIWSILAATLPMVFLIRSALLLATLFVENTKVT